MKKILILLLIAIIIILPNQKEKDDVLRIRVIANSNSEYDQKIKNQVSDNLKQQLYELLKEEKNIENARKIIKNNITNLSNNIEKNLQDVNYSYTINYGYNYFPEKQYKNTTYKEGNYESLLVKLGKAEGNNWWCILFPPLCLIEAEESNEEVEYQSFFINIINKLLNK